jgi:hypothetical protein
MNSSFNIWLLLVALGRVVADMDDAAKDEDGTDTGFVAPLPSVLLPTLTTFSPVARLRLMLLVDAAVTMGRFVGGISIWFMLH